MEDNKNSLEENNTGDAQILKFPLSENSSDSKLIVKDLNKESSSRRELLSLPAVSLSSSVPTLTSSAGTSPTSSTDNRELAESSTVDGSTLRKRQPWAAAIPELDSHCLEEILDNSSDDDFNCSNDDNIKNYREENAAMNIDDKMTTNVYDIIKEGQQKSSEENGNKRNKKSIEENSADEANGGKHEDLSHEHDDNNDDDDDTDDEENSDLVKTGIISDEIDLGAIAHNAAEHAEEFVRKVWEASWKVCHYSNLPKWLQDNDFLHMGHRPPLPSFEACFKSIFRIHTETGNIWTHLLGCVAFIAIAVYFLTRPAIDIPLQEKLIFGAFFLGAIVCLGLSFVFHTLSCHSEVIGKLFSKLDYCGIALLIVGSFVPWLYYGFYCHYQPKVVYLSIVCILGVLSIIVSLWDKFSEPNLRPLRAGVFMSFGLSGIIPAIHYGFMEGWFSKMSRNSLGWLILMGVLYILGAMFYALRVPERWFPGKCDIWFHSHQIFHVLVIAAAFVHYHGITEMALYRVTLGDCSVTKPADISL